MAMFAERGAERTEPVALTERVARLREATRTARIHADGERVRAFTAVWQETDGQPLPLRRAQAFRRYLETCTVAIFDDELIVGSPTRFRIGSHPYLEYRSDLCKPLIQGEEFKIRRETETGVVSSEDRKVIAEAASYWAGRSTSDLIHQQWREILGDDFLLALKKARVGMLPDSTPPTVKSADFSRALAQGFFGLIAEAKGQLSQLDYADRDAMKRRWMLQAMIVALEAMIAYACRYAEAARKLAEKETDTRRKAELLQIAENCSWVPGNSPRTFWEAVQLFWFVFLGLHLEVASHSETAGRLDQYLYRYYARDIEDGRLTEDEAAELLACLWVKFNTPERWSVKERQDNSQGSQQIYVTVGGVTPEGNDATNPLSFLILEVARQVKLRQPSVAVRWHSGIDEQFLVKAIEVNADIGGGIPSFLNDHNEIPNLMRHGVTLEDARNWAAAACVHPILPGRQVSPGRILITPTKVFEMALNNGVEPLTGLRLGIETGDPRTFTSTEEIEEAFKKQWQYWVRRIGKAFNIVLAVKAERDVHPFISAVQTDCIREGKDIISGGCGYPQMMSGFNIRGWQNIANSLAAIKKVIFEEKKATMSELLDALSKNYEGYEKLRQMLLSAPKWGNDDDYVDEIHKRLWQWGGEFTQHEYISPWGEMTIERGGATWHYVAGIVTGATPDGRKAFELLADGNVSAGYGTDQNGPTAVINSASKLNHFTCVSSLFNLKLPASLLRAEDNRLKVLKLITTYFNRDGYHVQFNIVDADALRRAKDHPEEYRDLIVRIAGFSVYFVELPSIIQDEIIARTEHCI
jgi:pyruvate formate-lyase/glycerol dehydratase family glycyl radical enzyme